MQPAHPISRDIAFSVGANLHALLLIVPAAIVLAVIFRPALDPPLWAVVSGVLAVMLAASVRFFVEYTLGLAAFWIIRLGALNGLYYTVLLFFSGQLAPLALFPPLVQWVGVFLPFRWMLAFPVELLLGRLTPGDALHGLGIQVIWLMLSLAGLAVTWHYGLRRHTAVGA